MQCHVLSFETLGTDKSCVRTKSDERGNKHQSRDEEIKHGEVTVDDNHTPPLGRHFVRAGGSSTGQMTNRQTGGTRIGTLKI